MLFRIFLIIFTVILAFFLNVKAQESTNSSIALEPRIVGGVPQKIKDRRFQVAVVVPDFICGGTILNMKWILTAVQCILDATYDKTYVRAGSNNWNYGGVVKWARRIIPHPDYFQKTRDSDIALILLRDPLPESNYISGIALADHLPAEGTRLKMSGYGTIYQGADRAPYLLSVYVNMLSKLTCEDHYRGTGYVITDTMFCAKGPNGGKAFCYGDIGGPLTYNGRLLGVISWSIGCVGDTYPNVFTSVPMFKGWIDDMMRKYS
ncbi:trypsin alpha-3-like [Condylostylus longicornis]|uniref:trypsin alpha-3-like n=1 Tax=Condylostylus longicornis TaxID=2530218 RepID=UPI00244DD8ED|nr:trypsin alpha-3-like [Condylostylus longicornis]